MINTFEELSNQDFAWLKVEEPGELEHLPCPGLQDVALIHTLMEAAGGRRVTHVARLLGNHRCLPRELWGAVISESLAV